ncbi:acyl-CoA dehydrogenase family protein [Pseudonocardia nematodicida]|uniref:Acyl-CoA dehydrogenase family protein n=1 Tax=Pseudonocardia nematodicida TaxID=1206997 RepID=A0ABV1KG11_9PSEU
MSDRPGTGAPGWASGLSDLPLPGRGDTATRWRQLTAWGRECLPTARLREGHTDALAILAELGAAPVPDAAYGVWASRAGGTGATLRPAAGGWRVDGIVRFCSGASVLDRALLVADAPGGTRVVDLDLTVPGIRRDPGAWRAAAMRASDTADVELRGVPVADVLGEPGAYTDRPGFVWGGGGVAAVWLGGAAGLVDELRVLLRGTGDPHRLAQLAEVHTGLAAVEALLERTAAQIDADPRSAHRVPVATARTAAERVCRTVVDVVPRAAGVAALAGGLADRVADLAIYIRQHHGERDLAALGADLLGTGDGR